MHNPKVANNISSLSKHDILNSLNNKQLSADSKIVSKRIWNTKSEKYLQRVYPIFEDWFNNKHNYTDISMVQSLPNNIDIFTYSFPCQDISQQGLQKGLQKGSLTRSSLLWEIKRIIKNSFDKPKILLMENVKAITNKNHISNFELWIDELKEMGYQSTYKILNASHFGSSQNRERCFMISFLNEEQYINFKWPNSIIKYQPLSNILNNKYDDFILNEKINQLINKYQKSDFKLTSGNIRKASLIGYSNFASEANVYDANYTGPTLTASGANSRLKILYQNKWKVMNAFESLQYMGIDSKDADNVISSRLIKNNKIIYTAGNAISIQVLDAIFKQILKVIKNAK